MASSKNYQWLALAVKNQLEKAEQRIARECLATLALVAGAGSESSQGEEAGSPMSQAEESLLGAMRPGGLAASHLSAERAAPSSDDSHSSHAVNAASPTLRAPPLSGRGQSHSASPRRNPSAAAASSVELGAQTLVDVVRARLRQGLRTWVTFSRAARLQDLHSSVLQALQTAVVASPARPAQNHLVATGHQNHTQVASPVSSHAQLGAAAHHDPMHALGHASPHGADQGPLAHGAPHVLHHVGHSPKQADEQSSLAVASTRVQPGAALSGRKYSGDSLTLRSKERDVRAIERTHGAGHPEVVRALLSLAGHHGELGNIEEQREAMQRALQVQEQHLHGCIHQPALNSPRAASAEHASHLLVESQPASKQISSVMGLLQRSPSPRARHHEASTDALVRDLYADQGRVDEVIKLANKLLESGMLAPAPRKPPILKSSLLLRLAERCHNGAMRDALQHWWRKCSLQRALQEMEATGTRTAQHHQHPSHQPSEKLGGTGSEADHSAGVLQDARHRNDDQAENQRLRAELQAMEERLAAMAARAAAQTHHLNDTSMEAPHDAQSDALALENARLREELHAMQNSSKRGLVVEQPMLSHGVAPAHVAAHSHHHLVAAPTHTVQHEMALGGSSSSRRPSSTSQHQQAERESPGHSDPLHAKHGKVDASETPHFGEHHARQETTHKIKESHVSEGKVANDEKQREEAATQAAAEGDHTAQKVADCSGAIPEHSFSSAASREPERLGPGESLSFGPSFATQDIAALQSPARQHQVSDRLPAESPDGVDDLLASLAQGDDSIVSSPAHDSIVHDTKDHGHTSLESAVSQSGLSSVEPSKDVFSILQTDEVESDEDDDDESIGDEDLLAGMGM